MVARRVLLVGESLFGEALEQTLRSAGVRVVGTAASGDEALAMLARHTVDVVVVATAGPAATDLFGRLLDVHPDLPILHSDLAKRQVQVITSQRVEASTSDLLAALASLPGQPTE